MYTSVAEVIQTTATLCSISHYVLAYFTQNLIVIVKYSHIINDLLFLYEVVLYVKYVGALMAVEEFMPCESYLAKVTRQGC